MFDTLSEYYQYRENLIQTFLCQSTRECREFSLQNIPPAPKLKRQNANVFLVSETLQVPCIHCQQITNIPLLVSHRLYDEINQEGSLK